MINLRDHPVGWAELMSNLDDAYEHLGRVITEMQTDQDFDEADFAIHMGHIAAHLNRAWFCRNYPDGLTDAEWAAARAYPNDLEPIA